MSAIRVLKNISLRIFVITFKDLRSAFRVSKTKWKIVVGHHGIRTTGHHCDTKELVTHLLPLLEVPVLLITRKLDNILARSEDLIIGSYNKI